MTIYEKKLGIFREKDKMIKDFFGESNYIINGEVDRTDSQLIKEANIEAQKIYEDIFGITKS